MITLELFWNEIDENIEMGDCDIDHTNEVLDEFDEKSWGPFFGS